MDYRLGRVNLGSNPSLGTNNFDAPDRLMVGHLKIPFLSLVRTYFDVGS